MQLSTLQIGGLLSILLQLTAARVVSSIHPMITPAPRSPFQPDGPYYGLLRRDDKDDKDTKDNDKDKSSTTAFSTTTANLDKGQCAFDVSGKDKNQINLVQQCTAKCQTNDDDHVIFCPDGASKGKKINLKGCQDGQAGEDMAGDKDDGDNDPYDKDGEQLLCTKDQRCVMYTMPKEVSTFFKCGDQSATLPMDSVMSLMVSTTSSSSSSSSSNSSATSSTTSSTSASTSTTSTATSSTASASPTAAATNGAADVAHGGMIAGAVVGSLAGAIGIAMLLYHLISSKIKPEDEDDSNPLIESKQWRGPWQGPGGE